MEKVEFIVCVNQEMYKDQCVAFINNLNVPLEITVSITLIHDAGSMTSAYNRAMKLSDAKYKVYLHQDVFLINKNFISEFIAVFQAHPEVGLLGVVGSKSIIKNGCYWNAWNVGETYAATPLNFIHMKCGDVSDMEYVRAVDGMLMITQYDVNWREDMFDAFDFYDISQSEEFYRAGYRVAVPVQKEMWCIHDCGYTNFQKYDIYRKRFCELYADVYSYEELEDQNAQREIGAIAERLLEIVAEQLDHGKMQEVKSIFEQIEQSAPENTKLVILYVMFCLAWQGDIDQVEQSVYGNKNRSREYIDTFLRYKFMIQRITYDVALGEYEGLWVEGVVKQEAKDLIKSVVRIVSESPDVVWHKMNTLIKR